MTINMLLHGISVGSLLVYVIASLIRPQFVAGVLEHALNSGHGISEFRIVHGGFFLGISLFALYSSHPVVYQALAAVVRILSYLPDLTAGYLAFLAAELILGIFLLH